MWSEGNRFDSESELLRALGAFANLAVGVSPPAADAFAMVILYEPKAGVPELDQRAARLFAQTVLHVVRNGIRHEERPGEFDQIGYHREKRDSDE